MEQLAQALFNLTDVSGEVRRKSEEYLNSIPDEHLAGNILQCLVFECPQAATQQLVRSMSAVVLRKKLTSGQDILYSRLRPDVQKSVRVGLLDALPKQDCKSVGRKLCDTIVDLAAVIFQVFNRSMCGFGLCSQTCPI